MMESTSSLMRWHKRDGLVSDEKMRHPADSKAWKDVDNFILNLRLIPAMSGWGLYLMASIHLGC
jgi:hypothetical protein